MATNRARDFRVTVTPMRITLHGPDLEPLNRVLCKYPDHHTYFLRVHFCDENGSDLFFKPKILLDPIYDRLKNVLGGISIAGRLYKLLGFSHLSLRVHSVWLCVPFVSSDGEMPFAERVIKGLGDFDKFQNEDGKLEICDVASKLKFHSYGPGLTADQDP